MIRLNHVNKTYVQGTKALENINLTVDDGEFLFIVGDSGSGKSTLLKLLTKEIEPTDGEIYVNGRCLSTISDQEIPRLRRQIGCVFQDFRLLKDRNIYENIAFAQRVIGAPSGVTKKRMPSVLSVVGLSPKYRSYPRELSGGEQQRAAIARALINEPSIILADEPTGNLDQSNAWEIMHLLEEINEKGTTVIVVTHNMELVREMGKRVVTIQKGSIIGDSKDGAHHEN